MHPDDEQEKQQPAKEESDPVDETPPTEKESPLDFVNRRMRELQEERRRKEKHDEGTKNKDDRAD